MANGKRAKAPWHFWVIGVMALLWYASGAITIQMAQLGQIEGLTADEAAYYAAKPAWLVISTAIGTYGSALATILLLLRMKAAVATYALALVVILFNDVVELANGASRAYANTVAAVVIVIIAMIAAFMFWYARGMQKRGVLT